MRKEEPFCPFCKSKEIEQLPTSNNGIFKEYEKVERWGNQTSTQHGTYHYPFFKGLCLDCGMIFEVLPDDILDDYKKDSPYFVQ